MSEINIVNAPPGIEGSGFFATSFDKVIGLARSHSLWPLPFATSCCGIEFMATMGSHYDFGRFGSERLSFSPRQADLLMVMGTIAKKMSNSRLSESEIFNLFICLLLSLCVIGIRVCVLRCRNRLLDQMSVLTDICLGVIAI